MSSLKPRQRAVVPPGESQALVQRSAIHSFQESYGGYSGALPNEKITWGKLAIDTPKFVIHSDATIVAPLVFGYVLGK